MTIKIECDSWEQLEELARQILIRGIPAGMPDAKGIINCNKEPDPEPKEPDPEPKEPEVKKYSMTEVRKFLADLRKDGKKEQVSALIRDLGFDKFTDIPEDKYAELMEKAGEL